MHLLQIVIMEESFDNQCIVKLLLYQTLVPTAVSKLIFFFFTGVTYYKAPPGLWAALEACPIDQQQKYCLCKQSKCQPLH